MKTETEQEAILIVENRFKEFLNIKNNSGELIIDIFYNMFNDSDPLLDDNDIQEVLSQCCVEKWEDIPKSFENFKLWELDCIEDVSFYDGDFQGILPAEFGYFDNENNKNAIELYEKTGLTPKTLIFSHKSWFIGDSFRLEVTFDNSLSDIISWTFMDD